MTSIYRFEKLEYFEQIVNNKELTFVSPFCWPDKNEGFLFRACFHNVDMNGIGDRLLNDRECFHGMGMQDVKICADRMFNNRFGPSQKDLGNFVIAVLGGMRSVFLAQCWSSCKGNLTLWLNKDLRIELSREDIITIPEVEILDVEYVDSLSIEDSLRRLNLQPTSGGGSTMDLKSVLRVKLKRYSSEQEVRLLTQEGENTNRDSKGGLLFTEVFRRLRDQGKMSSEEFATNISQVWIMNKKIPFTLYFIKSVMLSNSASREVEMKVQGLCQTNSLNYLGRWLPN